MTSQHSGPTPWLSVVMPTYNGARFVGHALESVVRSAARGPGGVDGVEVVIVDDGSTDDTVSVATRFADRLRLRLIEHDRVGNWAVTTNAGISEAAAPHLCFLHQDDAWEPERVNAVAGLLTDHPDTRLILHASRYVDDAGRKVGVWRCPLSPAPREVPPDKAVESLLAQNFVAINAPVARTADIVATGGLQSHLWYTADWDLWLRLAALGPTVYDPRPLGQFRIHAASQTTTASRDLQAYREQMVQVFEEHFARWDGPARRRKHVERIGRAAIEVNVALAEVAHHRTLRASALGSALLPLGPTGAARLLQRSRLIERSLARARAGLHAVPTA